MITDKIETTPIQSSESDFAKPLVAIRCITYNHEPYIRDALEGFVMQKTDFPFVAIVHDDASTDRTADIIREYAAKYPDIIKPIYETENQYSKPGNPLGKLMNAAVLATGAKYIALCEGDDYWTDPLKLQKQVDFLESHPDYSLVFANARFVYEDGTTTLPLNTETREYLMVELYRKYISPTPTVMLNASVYKSNIYHEFCKIKRPIFGDLTIFMASGMLGKIYGMSDVVCVYRRLSTGAYSAILAKNPYACFLNRIALSKHLGKEFRLIDQQRFAGPYFIPTLKRIWHKFPVNFQFTIHLFCFAPKQCCALLSYVPKGILRRLKKTFKTTFL